MTSDDITPERAREMLAADGQEVTDFTDAILAQWERDRARLATVTGWLDALVPLARTAIYGTGHTDTEIGRAMLVIAAIRAERATTGGTDADE
jgi:hypothetical protein